MFFDTQYRARLPSEPLSAFSDPECPMCCIQGKMVDMAVSHIYDAVYPRLFSCRTARVRADLDRAAAWKSVTPRERPGRTASRRGLWEAWRCACGATRVSRTRQEREKPMNGVHDMGGMHGFGRVEI